MNDQNNHGEEEEFEEEEIEVYEEVEVDEDAEVSDVVSPQKVPPNKIINQKEDKPILTMDSNNNPINANIPRENGEILNTNQNINENRNDNINTNVTDNRFLEEKIKFNDFESNLNNNNIREENFNYNSNTNAINQINNNFNTNENIYQSNFNPNININDNIYQSNNYNYNFNSNTNNNNNNYQSNNFNDNNMNNNNMYQSNNNYNPDDINNNNIYQTNNYNENNYQSNNLNGNDSINQSNNFNFNSNVNINVNDSNRFSNFNTMNMNINNDYNFDLSNNFNFDNRNTENKYLNLDYKIIPGRESLDFQPEMKFPFSLEKKESNSIKNSLLKESVNNMNNIPENEQENNLNELNSNNMSRQPQGHRSKIKRNNKKPLNLNFNNNNYNNNQDFQNTSKNMNLNNDSYFKDTENSTNFNIINKNSILSNTNCDELPFDERPINPKNTNYEDISSFDDRPIKPKNNLNYEDLSSFDDRPIKPKTNLNYEELPFDERPIKTSLNNIITSQNEAQSNNINQDELNANKDIIQDKNDNDNIQLNDKIKYNDPSNYYTFKHDDNNINNPATNTDINQSIEINNNLINSENNIEGVNMNEKDTNIAKDNIELNNGELNADNANKMNEDNNNNEGKKNQNIKKSKEDEDYSNIIVQLSGNNEIIDLLDSKKWEEKKQGFIKLNEFLTENMKSDSLIENNFDTLFNYILLKLNNFRETNFNLMKEGISCLNTLFSYFKENNKSLDKKYLETIIFMSNEKLADSKIKQVYTQLLNLLIDIYSYKTVYDLLFDIILFKTNKLTVLKEYSIFIRDNIKKENSINDLDLKKIIEFSVKIANHTNPQIRSISIEIICLLYGFIGPDLKQLITGIKESTFKLIEKELDKIVFDENDKNNSTNKNNKIKDLLNTNNKKSSGNKSTSASAVISPSNSNSNLINNKRVDISKDITPKLLKEINRGKWVEKKEGIEYINSLIDKANNKISKNGLQELFDLIKEKLNDGNINLVKMTLQLLSRLILALEGQIKVYSKNLIYPLLLKLHHLHRKLDKNAKF